MFSKTKSEIIPGSLLAHHHNAGFTYTPVFFDLNIEEQKQNLLEIIENNNRIEVFDSIVAQVSEYLKCVKPSLALLPKIEFEKLVEQRFADKSTDYYGIWVFYPWNNRLVHLLNEEEFREVRTNRNKYKITSEEQHTLSQKKIGIMGLSVGQSVALTLAMERGFGELRIADFDALDLSNLNRIRTGTHHIGLPKTVIVAREIAELDPYLKVTCFHEGITADNLDIFLNGNSKLDLLIDECDSFDIKINARKKAKALGIPVLMEGSDRGTIDIERFDLEPQRPVLHGMVDHLDMDNYANLKTMEERLPYISAVTGIETLSPRMKASAVELMATISTWPQLASAVTFGGGVSADLSRKILLNQLNISGRFFLDLDELISDPNKNVQKQDDQKIKPWSVADIENYIKNNSFDQYVHNGIDLEEKELTLLVEAARKAPSGGNNQPWRWHYQNKALHLFLEESSAQAYLDPAFISSYISLGTAIENLLLTAATLKLKVNWQFTPLMLPKHIAVFSFERGFEADDLQLSLAAQITNRHTNRKITPKQLIPLDKLEYLSGLAEDIDGISCKFVSDTEKIALVSNIASHCDLLRMFIPEAYHDFVNREMRWNLDEVNSTEDGIGIHTLDLGNTDQVGIRLAKDEKAIQFLKTINGGSGFKRLTRDQLMASSCLGLISGADISALSYLRAGLATERLWLGATDIKIQLHPLNVPLIFFYKNSIENNLSIDSFEKEKLFNLENDLRGIFELDEQQHPMFMFRLFIASSSPERTIRKSTYKIFSSGR
ncbi:Rv1355c family protein [Pedobacter sp.]|uniref:Rv1355c family protein n=1 Tax=Pedobacter sp. TaxID=1411316 RepID=UPI00396CC8A4